nr:HIRAN domain-containing protein [Tessaracoccus palaemonis]
MDVGLPSALPDEPTVPVVGVQHYSGWGNRRGRHTVTLVREPRNEYDPNAIAVTLGTRKIGHVPRERAVLAAPAMDQANLKTIQTVATLDDYRAEVVLPAALFMSLAPAGDAVAFAPLVPWGRCINTFEIEGEADHRGEIARLMASRGVTLGVEGTSVKDVPAHLVPSGGLRAPAVVVAGEWVGNLTDPQAANYATVVAELAQRGLKLEVQANVWARIDYGTVRANVKVKLPSLSEIEAPGPMPSGAYVLLPRGSVVQVTGEERYLNEVAALLNGNNEHPVVATLHVASIAKGKERIEVRVYGDVIGQLTPYMSENFLPLVKLCDEEGISVACHALVKGNQIKADIVLDTAKAGDLSDGWISEHVYRATDADCVAGPDFSPPAPAVVVREDMWTEEDLGEFVERES